MDFISAIPVSTGPDVILHQEYTDHPLGAGLTCQFNECPKPAYHRLRIHESNLETLACESESHYQQMGMFLVNWYCSQHPELYPMKGKQ